jgi:extradiol dioxygenase family protein
MLKLSTKSKHSLEEVLEQAKKFYGTGFGLKLIDQGENWVSFEGGGGSVNVIVTKEEKGTTVDVESVEWDYQTKELIQKVR